jgi:hypothetical protein
MVDFYGLVHNSGPGGLADIAPSYLSPINDRSDPWKGHPYRSEGHRNGWYRFSDAAISAIIKQATQIW